MKMILSTIAAVTLSLSLMGSANALDAESFFEQQSTFGEVRVDADSASEGRVLVPAGIFTSQ
ncbi:MAG: hypothetical protein AAFV45_04505 [Pseudomonadota bacterium]